MHYNKRYEKCKPVDIRIRNPRQKINLLKKDIRLIVTYALGKLRCAAVTTWKAIQSNCNIIYWTIEDISWWKNFISENGRLTICNLQANLSHLYEYDPDWVTYLCEMQSQLLEVGKKLQPFQAKFMASL